MRRLSSFGITMCATMLSIFTSTASFAQDTVQIIDMDVETDYFNKGAFYTQLWFWIVIGLVFLLILIALVRGGAKKDLE